jgi:hypothetical protein
MLIKNTASASSNVSGQFVMLGGERFYQIKKFDEMDPFFISVVSASDHWLFISSTGCLTAGRIRPENALFPYKSVDHIHEDAENTGSKTIIKINVGDEYRLWEPFNIQHNSLYNIERNIYKNITGDKIVFEEINFDLGLTYTYQWTTSDTLGFIRSSTLINNSEELCQIEMLDGLQNILPAGAPLAVLQTRSALVDAYKWNELLPNSSMALYSLYAKLSDRAEPAESLLATSVFSVTSDYQSILLSSDQLKAFRRGQSISHENLIRGKRGAYFIHKSFKLSGGSQEHWQIVANIDQSHSDVIALQNRLQSKEGIQAYLNDSIESNHKELMKLMVGGDAYQKTAHEETTVHHYANVLFNSMRGGVVVDQYWVDKTDFIKTLTHANKKVVDDNQDFLSRLSDRVNYQDLLTSASSQNDSQLERLCYEYLPLTFGRRHGDPSRPWNHFEIKLKSDSGDRLLSYQGNWRDIFQNWEALALSYPSFINSFIAKFVNASTIDGYNPYRITKEGVDWEILEDDSPWSNIGYWGDHQVIYLLKFLELSKKYYPSDLTKLLDSEIFSYANVPYEIVGTEQIFSDPKNTVIFNKSKQRIIEKRVEEIGSDGRLLLTPEGNVYLVNLTEKLLVTLLSKLSNFVIDGGVWLNTQRPEWNDANNAIVGNGISMVTLYYMRRYVSFLQSLLKNKKGEVTLSFEVATWANSIKEIFQLIESQLKNDTVTNSTRSLALKDLVNAAANYREVVYNNGYSSKVKIDYSDLLNMLEVSLFTIDESIKNNLRLDGLYNAYNIISNTNNSVEVKQLYPMLEGQVAVLSSGLLAPEQVVQLLYKLYASEMYRNDQQTFMLYPDRDLPGFINKNHIDANCVKENVFLSEMVNRGDKRIIEMDENGNFHFNAKFDNARILGTAIQEVAKDYPGISAMYLEDVLLCYEAVFDHQSFTGRSGTMFGYEGLGCIYWHMVAKLLLAIQENYFSAWRKNPEAVETRQLAEYYYKVRAGIGFNKTPENYGAFPTDPYSHTPKHAGAQQPGMTGQVKEEILTRFGELGLVIEDGMININPSLLKTSEFLPNSSEFNYTNIDGEFLSAILPKNSLAFTYCQVPFVYQMVNGNEGSLIIQLINGHSEKYNSLNINEIFSQYIFNRSNIIRKVNVFIPRSMLMAD